MRYLAILFCLYSLLSSCTNKQAVPEDITFQSRDKEILDSLFVSFENERGTDISGLMVKVGTFFLGSPYVAHTLEIGDSENLVVNLREFDCNTFVDNCLALSNTLKKKNPSFESFTQQLKNIRYRDKEILGYPSRLHYFSDWIYENHNKKLIEDATPEISPTIFPNRVNFMSTHPDSYKHLKNNPSFVEEIKTIEKEISQRKTYFIPKEILPIVGSKLKDGDIIGITTNITGLDIMHVGMAIRKEGKVHMLHASSVQKKVVITENTLAAYLMGNSRATGIIVARPK